MNSRTDKIYAALDQLCEALDLGRSESSTEDLVFILAEAFKPANVAEMETIREKSHDDGFVLDMRGLMAEKMLAAVKADESKASVDVQRFEDILEYVPAPRTDAEIGDAVEKLIDQVWYNRCHVPMFENLNNGTETCDPEIWKGALKAAEKIRAKYDVEGGELGPFTDLEWGMINGKLSALRWAGGDEWDSLDT